MPRRHHSTLSLTTIWAATCWVACSSGGDDKADDATGSNDPSEWPAWLRSSTETGFVDVKVGSNTTCALRGDGTVLCWGYHSRDTPDGVEPFPGETITALSGSRDLCALTDDGRVLCVFGPTGELTPSTVGSGVRRVVGDYALCVVLEALPSWAQCSTYFNEEVAFFESPDEVDSGWSEVFDDEVLQLDVAGHEACVATADEVRCTQVVDTEPPPGSVTDIAIAQNTACVATSARTSCPQQDLRGPYPTRLSEQEPSVPLTTIEGGDNHVCGLDADGTVHCWGQEGVAVRELPVPLTHISASEDSTCGLDIDGRVLCWGRNESNQTSPP